MTTAARDYTLTYDQLARPILKKGVTTPLCRKCGRRVLRLRSAVIGGTTVIAQAFHSLAESIEAPKGDCCTMRYELNERGQIPQEVWK